MWDWMLQLTIAAEWNESLLYNCVINQRRKKSRLCFKNLILKPVVLDLGASSWRALYLLAVPRAAIYPRLLSRPFQTDNFTFLSLKIQRKVGFLLFRNVLVRISWLKSCQMFGQVVFFWKLAPFIYFRLAIVFALVWAWSCSFLILSFNCWKKKIYNGSF